MLLRQRAHSRDWLAALVFALVALFGLLVSVAPASASLHRSGALVADALTTSTPHVYDGQPQRAKTRTGLPASPDFGRTRPARLPDTQGVNRGAQRLVTGNDESAYYTDDHYGTFTKVR